MKSRKLLATLLAMAMALSLAACGSGGSESPAPSTSQPAGDPPAPSTDPAAPAVEPLKITFSTTYNQTETGGDQIQHFCDTLAELSGGAIEVEVWWGGTVYKDPDILDALSTNAVNMTTFGHMPHITTLHYLGFPTFCPGGPQGALDFFNTIIFDDPETSALVQQELAEHNIIFLSTLAGGGNAFCAKFEFTDLDSLVAGSSAFGNMDAAIFEALGFQVTGVGPGEGYDGLQRGLIDATQMGLTPMVSMGWQQVAPYWALDGTYSAGNFISCNLDWWNGLTDAQREVIQAAADDIEEYSLIGATNDLEKDMATVEAETGNAFVQFSDEDLARIWAANFESKAAAAMNIAQANGKTEGMTLILEKCAEITGYDWQH